MTTVLIGGVGNLFLGDDAFGSELARRLQSRPPIADVVIEDFGIRTMDLFFALERCDRAIILDVVKRGGAPGTLYLIDPMAPECAADGIRELGGHGATSTDLVRWSAARRDRGTRPMVLRLLGCEPYDFGGDDGMLGLSPIVDAAMDAAVALCERVARELSSTPSDDRADAARGETACTSSG